MDKNKIEALAYLFNRSDNQTLFLLTLIDFDIDKLIELETKIKENFIHYCPSSIDSINKILEFEFKKDFEIVKIKNKFQKIYETILQDLKKEEKEKIINKIITQ